MIEQHVSDFDQKSQLLLNACKTASENAIEYSELRLQNQFESLQLELSKTVKSDFDKTTKTINELEFSLN